MFGLVCLMRKFLNPTNLLETLNFPKICPPSLRTVFAVSEWLAGRSAAAGSGSGTDRGVQIMDPPNSYEEPPTL